MKPVSSGKAVPYATTLLVRDCCLCLHVHRTARTLARRFDDALRPFDLTNGQFSLLMSLNRPAPPNIGSVARLLAMDRTTLTAALKPLERRRLVRVTPDPDDQRNRILRLTAKGEHLLAKATPTWQQTHHEVESNLASRDPDALRRDLASLA